MVGTIAVVMSTGTFTGTLSLSGANASDFQIVGTTLETVGTLGAGSYSIVITATEASATNSPFSTPTLVITNGAPVFSFQSITLSNSSFTANTNNATVGTINVVMNNGTFTGTLALSGTNASSFQIVGTTLETNGSLAAGTYSIVITGTQSAASNSPFSTSTLTITGNAPVISFSSITLSNNTFAANTSNATVGTINVVMSSGSFTGSLSLSGTNAANFQIVGTTLETNGSLAAGTYSIIITGTQAGATNSPFSTSALTVSSTAPPLTFTSITLSNNTFVNTVNNATVGTINVVMSSGSFTGTLALSGTNAASFRISGTSLQVFGVLAAGVYSVIITGTQAGATNSPFSTLALNITGSAATAAATTWNPSDEAGMTLTNGNLTATTSGATQAGVRSTVAMPGVPSYFEITLTTAGTSEVVGIANSSWVETASAGLGGDNNGIGLLETGAVHLNNVAVGSAMPAWTAATVLGVAVNPTTKKIFFTYNGTTWDATGSGDSPATNTGGYSWSTAVSGSYFIAFGALGSSVTSGVSGSQNSGASQPVVSGPTTATLGVSTTLAITGCTLADSNQPLGGTCALNIDCTSGICTLNTVVTGGSATGNGTNSIAVADTFTNCQTDLASLTYTASSSTGTDFIFVQLWDQLGLNNSINIAVTIAAGSVGIKILNTGEQAFSYTVPSGYLPWDNFPPSPPTNLTGAAGSTSVALTWTASAVGTAPITYTVQDRITGSSTWANVTTGLSSPAYNVTGLTTRTSYDFQVIAVNALGNAVTATFITVATTATGTTTGDATGVQAGRIADFLETIGVNCFFNNQDGAIGYEDYPNTPTNAQIANGYITGLQYLTASTGMGLTNRIYTDGTSTATENDQINICTLISAALPVKWTSCWSWTNAATQTVVNGLISAGILAFAEGVNEPNPGGNTNEPVADALTQQAFVWSTWNATQQVAAPSAVDNGSNTYEADYYGSSLATVAGQCTLWNGHNYPNGGAPSNDIYRRTLLIGANIGFPANGVVTEFHSLLYNTTAAQSAGEPLSCYYLACAWLAGYIYYNVKALIWFDMFDYQYNASSPPFAYPVGFFNQYNSSSPRDAATTVHNFFLFCADAATTRHTFTPGKLNYTLSGLPAKWTGSYGGITSTQASGGGQSALFQGSSGTFYLFVWNEQNALALGTTATVTVTFNSEAMTKVVDYSLTNPAGTANPAPIQTLTGVSTVTMHLTTEVRVLVITYP